MFEKSIALLGEVIFQPNIHENQFDDNVLNYMKEKAKKSILGVKESSRAYSTEKNVGTYESRGGLSLS